MNAEGAEWIDDDPEDDGAPDFSDLTSDPVGMVADQILLMIEAMKKEGFTRVQIMAGLTLAAADLAAEMAYE